jgi:hypothetical protein
MRFQSKSDTAGNMTTHEFAQLISGMVLVLETLPDVPLEELSSLADKAEEDHSRSIEKLMYKDIPFYLSQEGNFDEWSASVEWYSRLMDVDLEGMEMPTRENVLFATHRLINVLTDIRDEGVIHPESYFISR